MLKQFAVKVNSKSIAITTSRQRNKKAPHRTSG